MNDLDIAGLLGGTSEPLADSTVAERQKAISLASSGRTFVELGDLKRPVSQNFLALLFDMDPATVKKRLLRCPEIGKGGGGRPVYDFKQAVAYLVEPKMNIDEYIRSLDPNKMPNHINKAYWESKRIRLKYLLEAGQAWGTDKVLQWFGEVFMMIKNRVPLITENMRDLGLSDEQADKLRAMLEVMQTDLHEALVELPKKSTTRSLIADEEYDEVDLG